MRMIIAAAAFCGWLGAGGATAQVYEGQWCAIIPTGEGSVSERCDMRSFEMCREEIMGGVGGSCNYNPRYRGPTDDRRSERQRRPAR